ncbi:MAG: hypothetical protein PHW69_00750 [Elusimicrobiaceae bacterium]|nr:hypothetical protein [Elusimicrobiaceae bacterium]
MIPLLYLTDRKNRALIPDEKGIAGAFASAGMNVAIAIWDETDWDPYPNILIRTTWDYTLKPDLFLSKIRAATRRGQAVIHPEHVIRWNIDKRYLVELARAGHKVVPTCVEENFRPGTLAKYFGQYPALVLKPAIGAGGRDTFKMSAHDDPLKPAALFGGTVLIQPFIPEIETVGEHSFIFFNEEFSHAVLKKAGTGEFRVQDDHGGTVEAYSPSGEEIRQARRLLQSAGRDTTYARVDAVKWNGEFHLMELEIIEPELFFRFSNHAMNRFALAVRAKCG